MHQKKKKTLQKKNSKKLFKNSCLEAYLKELLLLPGFCSRRRRSLPPIIRVMVNHQCWQQKANATFNRKGEKIKKDKCKIFKHR